MGMGKSPRFGLSTAVILRLSDKDSRRISTVPFGTQLVGRGTAADFRVSNFSVFST